ncbi:MAG: GAF domain-containing protein [Oscillatoria princeps RMCB-10]|jgi:signal transduction histidine kinase|nr:GAF domain-containing protein [Oscillatoria princeps RMCB-10]
MRNFAGAQWRGLTQLWQRRSGTGWQPRHLVVLLIIGGTALAVSSCAALSYSYVRGLILDNLKANALLKVQLGRDEIDEWLVTRKTQVEMLASSPLVRSLDWEVAGPYLKSEAARLKDFFLGFTMVNHDGSHYNTLIGRTQANVKDRRYFKQAIAGKISVSDPLIGRSSKIPSVVIAAPLWSVPPAEKQVIGVTTGNITVERLAQVVGSLEYGTGSYAFALNSVGVPIVHPNPAVMGNQDKAAASFLEANDANLASVARQMVDKKSDISLVRIDGQWVYVAYLPLRQVDWSIALVIPRSNLESNLGSLNLLALVVGGLLAVAMLAAVRLVVASELSRATADREALLNRLTGRIRASLDLDTILQTTVGEVGSLLHLERAAFGWYDSQLVSLEILWEYCRLGKPQLAGLFDVSSLGDLEGRLQRGEPVRLSSDSATGAELRAGSYVALPVRTQGVRLGYLLLVSGGRWFWNLGERELLEAVADQLAIAITQSQLYTQTQAQVKLLDEALKKLQTTQAHLVQSEKMSSLGQMVAGIAHEINNPVNFIHANLPYVRQYADNLLKLVSLYQQVLDTPPTEIGEFEEKIELEFIQEDLPQILKSMSAGTERIRQIVLSLRNFSRLDEAEKKEVDLHEGIDSTLLLLAPRLEDKIKVVKDYGQLPNVECYAGQLNQVFMNLLTNAIDALEEGKTASGEGGGEEKQSPVRDAPYPTIRIRTWADSDRVAVAIADNGPGIPAEIKDKIFDPFFTTKPVGKGTGLGLAICYQIVVQVHAGKIRVETPPLGGTEFVLEIPIRSQTRPG